MKRFLCLFLATVNIFLLCACGGKKKDPAKTEATPPDYTASQEEIDHLEKLYAGRTVYFGEMHDHANTGGTSDGKYDLVMWRMNMDSLKIDFATIVDHRQVHHMYLDEWKLSCFVGGSEAMAYISDSKARNNKIHYNMIFTDVEAFKRVLSAFPEYGFGANGHFNYPPFTTARFQELIAKVKEEGGLFAHVHPKSDGYIDSDDPLDYWFADETSLEVFYGFYGRAAGSENTEKNYKLWTDLLAAGKRIWASAGGDQHRLPATNALTAIYAEEKTPESLFSKMRVGDYAPGPVGIRMAIGDTMMGGKGTFDGQKIVFSVGQFHESILEISSSFRVALFDDKGQVFSQDIDHTKMNYFSMDAGDSAFYRVEVYDQEGTLIALGNPIWRQ